MDRKVKRGDVYFADLQDFEAEGLQSGKRPVVITQSNRLNKRSKAYLAAIITSKLKLPDADYHVLLGELPFLPKASMVAAEQRFKVPEGRLIKYMGSLDDATMKKITRALHASEEADRSERIRRGSKLDAARKRKQMAFEPQKSTVRLWDAHADAEAKNETNMKEAGEDGGS